MRRGHFAAYAPVCPVCAAHGRMAAPLVIATVTDERPDGDIRAGILHCAEAACRHEYPIIDDIPIIVPQLARLLTDRGVELLLRDDLHPLLESLAGDAIGPDSWFDALRQTQSTYGWDGYADLDPDEPAGSITPGAVRRCLAELCRIAGPLAGDAIDLGCGAGRSSFDLAAAIPGARVLGIDTNLGLLRLAAGAARGQVTYPVRQIGLVYRRARFAVALPASERVDFWAVDAQALPFTAGRLGAAVALNLLDCVPDPATLLADMTRLLRPGGHLLLATPFDWSTRATQPASWIGGHSQRADHGGSGEAFLRQLVREGAHPRSVAGLIPLGECHSLPWHTRLHARSIVQYDSFLMALRKTA